MRYQSFIIENYRAINGPLEVHVQRRPLIPIIGINESGKTTVLQALFAFDFANDTLNDNGRHLKDVQNLYGTDGNQARISADITLTKQDFLDLLNTLADEAGEEDIDRKTIGSYRRLANQLPGKLRVTRTLDSLTYSIEWPLLKDAAFNHRLAEELISRMPYILYFDDFRDSIEERIEIDSKRSLTGWLQIIEQLFKKTNKSFSVLKLNDMEERQRKSTLAAVKQTLNDRLTKEWQNFRLDDVDMLQINIEFERDSESTPNRAFLKLEVVDTNHKGRESYFYIRDRSKGFYWFFNFVMKLEFNPKISLSDGPQAIYLLDEPGSYLHSSAQSKLCAKLRDLSIDSTVIYCTHSHYLLDPEVIPISTIHVADKSREGNVSLIPIHEHAGSMQDHHLAFQPILDALQVNPYSLDLTYKRVVIVEGIVDYYAFEMMKGTRPVNILPAVGARSIEFHVSSMLAWKIQFATLWDNDTDGRESLDQAKGHFGDEIANRYFRVIPAPEGRKRILQDLFDGSDLVNVRRELGLPKNTSFDKTLASWFYSSDRDRLVKSLTDRTRENFDAVFDVLGFDLEVGP